MIVELLWLAAVLGLLLCVLAYRPVQATWYGKARVRLAYAANPTVSELSKERTISQDPGGGFAAWGTRTGPPGSHVGMMVRAFLGAG